MKLIRIINYLTRCISRNVEFLQIFKVLMSTNEVIRLRLYEMFVGISTISPNNFKSMEADEFLPQILTEIESNDVLLRMNIIELLSQLVTTEIGYEYLESQGVIENLFQQLRNKDEFLAEICEPGLHFYTGFISSSPCFFFYFRHS